MNTDSISSGIPELDDSLGGGFPKGSLTALLKSGHTMGDRIAYEGVSVNKSTILSLLRPERLVEKDINEFHGSDSDCDIIHLRGDDNTHRILENVFDGGCEYVIIEGAERLFEEPRSVKLVQEIATKTLETGCSTVLSFSIPLERLENEVLSALNLCDVVISFNIKSESGQLESWATVTKQRFNKPTDPIKLLFDPHPDVDETKRIN